MGVTLAGMAGLPASANAPCGALWKICKSHGGHLNLEERERLSLSPRYALATHEKSD